MRVCALEYDVGDDTLDLTADLRRPNGKESLNSIQSLMLDTARRHNGLMAFAGTGSGKAWTAILLGSVMQDVDRVLVFAPAATLNNLNRERLRLRPHFYIHEDLQFHSYEALQRATPEGQLDYIEDMVVRQGGDPNRTLLVFDEAHWLKNITSARGARILRFVLKYPGVRVCMLSGSMTDKSIKDYAHLSWMALRNLSPMPAPWLWPIPEGWTTRHPATPVTVKHTQATDLLNAWSAVLDKDGQGGPADWYTFRHTWNWAYGEDASPPSSFSHAERVVLARRAQQYRLRTCPGVVLSRATSLENTALVIHGIDDFNLPLNVKKAMDAVEDDGEDPDGNALPDRSAVWRVKRQIAQGFYYIWDWPVDNSGKPIRDEEWLDARSDWNKMVRREIKERAVTGYDSALLVYNSVRHQIRQHWAKTPLHNAWLTFVSRSHKDEEGNVSVREREALGHWLAAGGNTEAFNECETYFLQATKSSWLHHAWVRWSSRHKHRQRPPTKPVWISSFFIDRAMQWVADQEAQGHKVLVWYDQQAVGDELGRRGLPVFGAGTDPTKLSGTDPAKAFSCALSLKTHSEGKNLQAWHRSLILCPPASGVRWEQALARTHRTGQTAEVVRWWVMLHLRDFKEALAAARAAADYVQTSTDNAQKLLHASLQDVHLPKVGSEKVQEWETLDDDNESED